jgi:hypothetical protein
MARKQNLKVYRTSTGFHDAYVAAPSQKAALEAWGSDANLFARGMAELVTDEDLSREPLANPGKIIRKLRGTAEEQIAALPPSAPATKAVRGRTDPEPRSRPPKTRRTAPAPPKAPRPDRAPLDAARKALENADLEFVNARRQWATRQAELERERRSLEREHDKQIAALQRELDQIEADYGRAIKKWRG